MIRHTNYDGSIQLDVFDLYKSDKEGICFVIEDGQIIHENNLKGCLNFVHKWLWVHNNKKGD